MVVQALPLQSLVLLLLTLAVVEGGIMKIEEMSKVLVALVEAVTGVTQLL
jgi:hypothetical protein